MEPSADLTRGPVRSARPEPRSHRARGSRPLAASGRPALLVRRGLAGIFVLAAMAAHGRALAQDIEPRRWSHLPVDTNLVGLAYSYTEGRLFLDPVLEIEDGTVETHTAVSSYLRTFDCFGKTGRIDVVVPYQSSRWEGLLSGAPASRQREGFADPWVRLSVNLIGAPARKGQEYLQHRAAHKVNTVVGAALAVMLPLGDYQADKLLNLGQNRFIFRPQIGIVHVRGPWSYELTSSMYFFTENDDFFGGNKREQDPLFALQGHVVYSFPTRAWVSLSSGHGFGGESSVNGVSKDDERGDLLGAISFGVPVGKSQGLKLSFVRAVSQELVGGDTSTLLATWSLRF